jgi:hypothetical protein
MGQQKGGMVFHEFYGVPDNEKKFDLGMAAESICLQNQRGAFLAFHSILGASVGRVLPCDGSKVVNKVQN